MPLRIVRLGTPRTPGEGLRLGTVRRPPRGVAKAALAARDFYDVWLPQLAPSEELLKWARAEPLDGMRWKTFARRYAREMAAPDNARLITALAALSQRASFSAGCYCEDASRCHRSLLRDLFERAGASLETDDR